METLIPTFVFIFGVIIGSFLNVVILRHNTGFTLTGRSQCLSCGHKISWFENIPILSFIFLKGHCSGCQSKISWQYPLVELGTGLLFLISFLKVFDAQIISSLLIYQFAFTALAFSLFVVIFVYDIHHKIIPNRFMYSFIALSFLATFLGLNPFVDFSIDYVFAGLIVSLPIVLLWAVSSGRWIGFGDAKLAWGMGWFLGPVFGLSALVLGFWLGAIYSILAILFQRFGLSKSASGLTMKSEVPFAPFLILATIVMFLFPVDFLHLNILLGLL